MASAPEYNFYAAETADGMRMLVKSRGPLRLALAFVIIIPAAILGFIGLAALGSHKPSEGGVAIVVALIAGFLAFLFGNSRSTTEFKINAKTLSVNGQDYDLDHIAGFVQNGPGMGGYIAVGGIATGAAMLGQQMNQMLYVVYGARQIKILSGQTPVSIMQIYSVIVGYLLTVGRQFGEANENDIANYKATAKRGIPRSAESLPRWVKTAAFSVIGVVIFFVATGPIIIAPLSYQYIDSTAVAEFEAEAAKHKAFDGKYYLTRQGIFAYNAPTREGTKARFVFLGGACVKSIRADGETWVELDLPTPNGRQHLYARLGALAAPPNGTCKPSDMPVRARMPNEGID